MKSESDLDSAFDNYHATALRVIARLEEDAQRAAAAERSRIRRELLDAMTPEIRMHRIAGSRIEVEAVLVSWLKYELDRICAGPEAQVASELSPNV